MTELIPSHFNIKLSPEPRPAAVVISQQARFTVLTPRMIRIEWSPAGTFEDRASQAFWFRNQPVPQFSSAIEADSLVIETEYLRLTYQVGALFSASTLQIALKEMNTTWMYGDPDPGNLGGTARTLDEVDGATPLGLGLISRSGWSLVDDSSSLVFNNVGWLEPREAPAGQLDLVFFGYGHDYLGCLRDFNQVSGAVPMIPRFILGNWWSRYWKFSQDELKGLMNEFQERDVPLSVCIIDMDWHITQTGNESSGWTGYTWNRELFPDPEGTIRYLHEMGLKVALNLHPADGVHRHEEMYVPMCNAIGQDPNLGQPVEFDITNPRFVDAYFRLLHHTQEARGIDFWWMDWQQGVRTRLSGLDPLWWLNHLHFLDLGRDGKRRSFIFSRWGGLGNHRYPIGFSGDSVVTWASLAFQPYFTATSSNVNYGWWSHDIGGHMGGIEDAELYTRWVQLGVFQPVLRLHSTNNPFHDRRPWGYDDESFAAAQAAMQLRHALIPYLYSMAWRFHNESIPPILPMYYAYPEQEEAYACPNQYQFGNQLIAAPFITPQDGDTRLSRSVVWLPDGDWFGFFDGAYYPGGGWQANYGTLRDIPVFAKAGAIVPQGPLAGWDTVEKPNPLIVNVFPGADGSFELYEDEGNSNAYLNGEYSILPIRQTWSDTLTTLQIGPARGDASQFPVSRNVEIHLRGYQAGAAVEARINGQPAKVNTAYDPATKTITVSGAALTGTDTLTITLSAANGLADRTDSRLVRCQRMLRHFRMESWTKNEMAGMLPQLMEQPGFTARFLAILSEAQVRAIMETLTGAGMDVTTSTGEKLIVIWNNQRDENVTHQFSLARLIHIWRYPERYPWYNQTAPKFTAYRPTKDFGEGNPWVIGINYYGFGGIKTQGK